MPLIPDPFVDAVTAERNRLWAAEGGTQPPSYRELLRRAGVGEDDTALRAKVEGDRAVVSDLVGVTARSRRADNPILHHLRRSVWGWHTACNGGRAYPVDPTQVVGRECVRCNAVRAFEAHETEARTPDPRPSSTPPGRAAPSA